MVTTVGMEKNIHTLISNLIELDYDAVEAYQAAIDRIDSAPFRKQLTEFMADHVRHTQELGRILVEAGRTAPSKGDMKSVLTKGKVVLASLAGDKAILMAMKTNEDDTNTAYERAFDHPEATGRLRDCLRQGLDDERRHRDWIEKQLATLK